MNQTLYYYMDIFSCVNYPYTVFYNILQIFLLASKPTVFTLSILRLLIHYVYGALIAMLFPEIGGRVVCLLVALLKL